MVESQDPQIMSLLRKDKCVKEEVLSNREWAVLFLRLNCYSVYTRGRELCGAGGKSLDIRSMTFVNQSVFPYI